MKRIIELRHRLNACPELSGHEVETKAILKAPISMMSGLNSMSAPPWISSFSQIKSGKTRIFGFSIFVRFLKKLKTPESQAQILPYFIPQAAASSAPTFQ